MSLLRCPYCKGDFLEVTYAKHVAVCLANEEVRERLRTFLRATAKRGYILPARRYERESRRAALPNRKAVVSTLGGWRKVAEWAGLAYAESNWEWQRTEREPDPDVPDEAVDRLGPEPERDAEYRTFEGMPARPGVYVRPAWCVRSHRYVPVQIETGWMMLV